MVNQYLGARIIRLPATAASELFQLHNQMVEVGQSGEFLYVRQKQHPMNNAESFSLLGSSLPGERYYCGAGDSDELIEIGKRVPTAKLPDLQWAPIEEVLSYILPVPAVPGTYRDENLPKLRLVAFDRVQPAGAMIVPIASLTDWAERTIDVRLQQLTWLMNSKGDAIVFGTPLPPLPGRRLWASGRIWLPLGMTIAPSVPTAVVEEVFGIQNSSTEQILWLENCCQAIDRAGCRTLNRASVRIAREETN